MATNMSGLNQPPQLELRSGNIAQNWTNFKQRFELFNTVSGMTEKGDKAQCSLFLHCIGDAALQVYNTFEFPDENDKMKLKVVMKKFEDYCIPKRNVTYERYKFFNHTQQTHETIDQYCTELRERAKSCEFGELTDSLIQDRIICGMRDNSVRERLLRQEDLTLDKTLKLCRAAETTREQAKQLSSEGDISVDAMGAQRKEFPGQRKFPGHKSMQNYKQQNYRQTQTQSTQGSSTNTSVRPKQRQGHRQSQGQGHVQGQGQSQNTQYFKNPCSRCGNFHGKNGCPAQGQVCRKCGRSNHFAKCCRTQMKKGVNELTENEVDHQEEYRIDAIHIVDAINAQKQNDEWRSNIEVNKTKVNFKLDSGSKASTIPESVYTKLNPKPVLHKVDTKLVGYGGSPVPCLGRCYTQVKNKGKEYNMSFYVVKGNRQPLMGLSDCVRLGLVKRVNAVERDAKQNIADEYPDVFKGLGCLPGKHHIEVKENAQPVKNACRKVPFPIRDKLKAQLDKMENDRVIESVDEPTEWVSSLVVVMKKNGQLRVCLDPRNLNKVIKREHYKLPSRDEITAEFANAKYFSKLDASSGFWQIELDEESSRLCTFITPFGRYKFLRLPFGICSAPEVFHKIIHNLFVGIPGVNTMMDDIVVWGSTQEEHDDRLRRVLEIAQRSNLKLNRDKCEFNVNHMTFIGDMIGQDGVKPDPKKVTAINNMARPACKSDVQRFLGMVNYQGKFIANLSGRSAPLRILLDKKTEWMWEDEQEKAWCELKNALMDQPVLRFYDSTKPTKISADASKNGLGAVLLQQHDQTWHPVAYASRAMLEAETRYAQIEKELLAITYGCERFHQYIYGQVVEVETDHKPLVPLFVKPLSDCPLRIQRLLLRVQRYDLKVSYTPGKFMYTADTLSRAVDPEADQNQREEDIGIHVDSVIETLPVSSDRKKQFVQETKKDKQLQDLLQVIREGWPADKHKCQLSVREYWDSRSELSEAHGFILKGNRLVVPRSMRKQMLNSIHEGHLGIEKCKRRAREVLYWPQMNTEITDMIENCTACLLHKPKQQQESLRYHQIPDRPWEKIGSDLFQLNGKDYLVVVDYYSQFIELRTMTRTTSQAVISQLKEMFSRQGTPQELITDNGPQYASAEFKQFAREWDFIHTTTSPYYPQSNGRAEGAVKICKNLLKKCHSSGQDIHRALQIYRSTPLDCGKSPAELLYNRRIRLNLPMLDNLLDPQNIDSRSFKERKERQKAKQKQRYDQHARDLPELQIGQHVRILDMNTNKWSEQGVVKVKLPNRSYVIKTDHGVTRRRNRRHIRPVREEQFTAHDSFDDFEDDPPRDVRDDHNGNHQQRDGIAPPRSPPRMTTRSGRSVKRPVRLIEQ